MMFRNFVSIITDFFLSDEHEQMLYHLCQIVLMLICVLTFIHQSVVSVFRLHSFYMIFQRTSHQRCWNNFNWNAWRKFLELSQCIWEVPKRKNLSFIFHEIYIDYKEISGNHNGLFIYPFCSSIWHIQFPCTFLFTKYPSILPPLRHTSFTHTYAHFPWVSFCLLQWDLSFLSNVIFSSVYQFMPKIFLLPCHVFINPLNNSINSL